MLLANSQVTPWEELGLSSQRHLIADAENFALNQSITATELAHWYRERLIASGDLENPDLAGEDAEVEAMVLTRLKECLADNFTPQPDSRLPPQAPSPPKNTLA